MNDDETLEKRIDRAWADNLPGKLRGRVLARVSEELNARPTSRRSRGWAVAAALLLALGFNAGAGMIVDHRVAYYRENAQATFDDQDQRNAAAVDTFPTFLTAASSFQQAYDEPTFRREDFERYLRELITRTSQSDAQHLP